MVLEELAAWMLGGLFDTFGLSGVSVGALAALVVGGYHSRHIAHWMVRAARFIQIAVIIVVVLGGAFIVGVGTGAISLDGGILSTVFDTISSLLGGHV